MYPWLWFWAPQLHFPWSGSVAQKIEPEIGWLFQGIKPGAGNARIEEKAYAVASYGKQLGLITEVLIDLAKSVDKLGPQAGESLERLTRIKAAIDEIKSAEYEATVTQLEAQILELRRRGGSRYEQLADRLRSLLDG